MALLEIRTLDDSTFVVTVSSGTPTSHRVTVAADYAAKLTGGRATTEQLIRCSFEFLLEREPNTSILSHFDLTVIGRYFPEYETKIASLLNNPV